MNLKTFVIQQTVAGAIINAVINGAFGWAALPGGLTWPLFGVPSLCIDIVLMSFGIGFGTGLILTPQLRKQIATGKVTPPPLPDAWNTSFAKWPASGLRRGLNIGVLGVLVCGLPVLAILAAMHMPNIDRAGLTAFKAIFGGIEGAVVTPLLAVAVISDAHRSRLP